MSNNIKRFSRLIEKYVNEYKKQEIEEFYGPKTNVKVHTINYSTYPKLTIIIECIVVLGDVINEDTLDRRMIDYLIKDACEVFFPDCGSIKTMIRWD